MKIIRGRLNPADVSNPMFRYNSDCDCIQQTPDNGTTWVDNPAADPRHSVGFLRPPVAGSNKQCDAAANMTKWLKDFIDYETALMVAGATITTLINGILTPMDLLFPAADFLSLIIDIADTIFGIGATALTAAFTSTEYELLQCIFFCRADLNGVVNAAALAKIESDITAQLNTTAALVVNAILFIQGEVGLSNAGSLYTETGDCSACACGWTKCWYWTTDSALNGFGVVRGTWAVGDGYDGIFVNSSAKSSVILDTDVLPSAYRFTHIEITYSASIDVGSGGLVQIDGYLSGTRIVHHTQTTSGSHLIFAWDGDEMFDEIVLAINSGADATTAKIELCTVSGLETEPDLGTDC